MSEEPRTLLSDDLQVDAISGSLTLWNGVYKGLHRQIWYIREEQKSGIHGGTFEALRWIPRTLNVLDGVAGSNVSLCQNDTIRIEPGIYAIEASAPAVAVGTHQVRFQNVTDQMTESWGTNSTSPSDESMTRSELAFHLRVNDTPKLYELQHKASGTTPWHGFGLANDFEDSVEIYSIVKIQKLL
jgi:hypothetical protein